MLGPRAEGPRQAGGTVGLAEHHRDVGRAGVVGLAAPGRGRLPLRAAGLLPLPVDLEPVDAVATLDLHLPGWVRPWRSDQLDGERRPTAYQQLGIDVGCIDQVFARMQALAGQGLVNRL